MNKENTKFQEPFNWSDEASYGNEWDSDPIFEHLGHSTELKELDEDGIGEIVQRLADNSKMADQFRDIVVLHSNQDNFIGCVDVRNSVLYLNASNKVLSASELIQGINGLMNHESLHINNWLGIPGNSDRALKNAKVVEKHKGNKDTLNWLYDLEGHYHSSKGFLNPIQQLELREFITTTRNKVFDIDPKNPVLSMEDPKTKLQKAIRKLILDRSKTIMQKAKILSKLLKDNNYPQMPQPGKGKPGDGKYPDGHKGKEGDGSSSANKGNKKSKDQEDQKEGSEGSPNDSDEGQEPIVITKIIGESKKEREWLEKQLEECHTESLKKRIATEQEYRELQKKVQRHGISAGNAKDIVEYYKENDPCNPNNQINALNRCLKDMLGFDSGFLRKLKEPSPRIGYRMNGYRRARDIQEMAQSVESLVTDGLVDINDVRVPDLIKRKRKGIMIIIRDVSGSVLSPPVDRVVRDATMYLISQAKKEKHKVAVLDFSVGAEFIPDHNGNELTENYENILGKSVYLKGGGGTIISDAVKALNKLIEDKKLHNTPINIYVITDSLIHDSTVVKINSNKFNLTGIVYNTYRDGFVDSEFKEFIKTNNGKTFFIQLSIDKKLINGLKSISSGSD